MQQREVMHTDRSANTSRQKCRAKESGEEIKIQEFMYRDTTMRKLKCTIIPVIIGTTGIVMKRLKKNLEAIPGKHSIESLQKTAIQYLEHHTKYGKYCSVKLEA
jgi:hypothetical protein